MMSFVGSTKRKYWVLIMTPDERIAKCLSQCVDAAREKVEGQAHLAKFLPLYRAMVSTEDAFPELYQPRKDN
jgi:hypothetical protein